MKKNIKKIKKKYRFTSNGHRIYGHGELFRQCRMSNLAKKMPEVLNYSMSSTVRMNEEAGGILSKPVIKKKKEPYTSHMLLKLYKCLVEMVKIFLI